VRRHAVAEFENARALQNSANQRNGNDAQGFALKFQAKLAEMKAASARVKDFRKK
jgi:hypothetical protein